MTEYDDLLTASKDIRIKGNCGTAKSDNPDEMMDPDVMLQQSCISGLISNIAKLSFTFDYFLRKNFEPFTGSATVELNNTDITY